MNVSSILAHFERLLLRWMVTSQTDFVLATFRMAGIREQSANSGMDELEGERNGPGNDHVEETRLTKSAIVFAACAAINSINLGYDIGISTSAGKLVQEDMGLSLTARELFVGSLNFWASTL